MSGGNSYNGWPANSDGGAIGIDSGFRSQGADFPGGMKAGDVSTVFDRLITRLHNDVEAMMIDPDNGSVGYGAWGYSYRANVNNPSSLSCHASGTAIDYNAPLHPNGTSTGPGGGGGWSSDQYYAICVILDELQGAIDWLSGNDPMHFEIDVDAGTLANIAAGLPAGGGGGGPTPAPPDEETDEMAWIVLRDVATDCYYLAGPKSWLTLGPGAWNPSIPHVPAETYNYASLIEHGRSVGLIAPGHHDQNVIQICAQRYLALGSEGTPENGYGIMQPDGSWI